MKDIVSLRNHLFDALNRIAEASTPEEVDLEITKAASIVQVSESIINSARIENEFISLTKAVGSGFIPLAENGNRAREIEDVKEPKEMFDVDKEENWLNQEQGKINPAPTEYDSLK